jgi:FkbM family methyltransferase
MKENTPPFLSEQFYRRWEINQRGGLPARLSRWRILHWVILQKLGINCWARAPLFFGEKLWLLTGEEISSGILGFGYAEKALTALMLEVIKPGMRVVDIGAHIGYEAMLASVLVRESGRVVTFEPQPQISNWTVRNLRHLPQCRVVLSAVGDSNGFLEFSEMDILNSAFSGQTAAENPRKIQVPVSTLDHALRGEEQPVDFIKCDVEGGEMSVLRGAVEILKRDQPLLVLEAEMPSVDGIRPRVKEFADFLAPLGYEGFFFEFDGALRVGHIGELEVGHANVGFAPVSRTEFSFLLKK